MKKTVLGFALGLLLSGNAYAGLFKSGLEECADYKFRSNQIFPKYIYKLEPKSKDQIEAQKKHNDKLDQEIKKIRVPVSNDGRSGVSYEELVRNSLRDEQSYEKTNLTIVKELSERELDTKYNLFLRSPIKKKLNSDVFVIKKSESFNISSKKVYLGSAYESFYQYKK